jgi:nucleotide-binding universal stress UspA family protein
MKVLIAIDSSPCSQRVLDEASARPWPLDTTFFVLNVVDFQRFARFPLLIENAKLEATEMVNSAARQLIHAGHQALAEVRMGFPRKVISECAMEVQADLIMVGSHGHSAIGRFLLGSVAQAVLRIAPCPVEIVRFPAGSPAPSSHAMKVLLATDGSECSVAAANSVAARPWPAGTVFKVVGVEELIVFETPVGASPLASVYPGTLLEELLADARTRAVNAIDSTRKILEQAGLKVQDRQPIPLGDPRNVILVLAQTWSADLIVLGSHGRRGWDRFLMGSVAEGVAVHAHCSVGVIRPRSALQD